MDTAARALYALRWIAVIPAALIGAGLAQFAVIVGHSGEPHAFVRTFSNAVFGVVVVWSAAYVAPSHKSHSAVFVAGFLIAGSLAVWMSGRGDAWDTYASVVSSVAALITCAEVVRSDRC